MEEEVPSCGKDLDNYENINAHSNDNTNAHPNSNYNINVIISNNGCIKYDRGEKGRVSRSLSKEEMEDCVSYTHVSDSLKLTGSVAENGLFNWVVYSALQ